MPEQPRYFNLHSHRKPRLAGELTIRNAYTYTSLNGPVPYLISVGVHPWFVGQWSEEATRTFLEKTSGQRQVVAIGECGLDRVKGPSMTKQLAIFDVHCQYASIQHKPMIIHAVRSYYDFIPFLKQYQVPMIFHGFNGNIDILQKLLPYNTWFSFGKLLFQPSVERVFKRIDPQRIFLETDQAAHLHIADIYRKAAELMNLPEEEVSERIWENVNTVFGKPLFIEHQ